MDADFPDPTDWISTPVPGLQALETALRCQVCKEFFTAPKVTSCGHTFCSLCIRRCLSATSKCPTCMKPDQEPRLRDNIVLSELVSTFNLTRKPLLQTLTAKEEEERRRKAEEAAAAAAAKHDVETGKRAEKRSSYGKDDDEIMLDVEVEHRPRGKRRRQDGIIPPRQSYETEAPRRSTRTSSQRTNSKISSQSVTLIEDSDEDFEPIEVISDDELPSNVRTRRKVISRFPSTPTKNSDLVACMVCSRMKEKSKLEAHVNRCLDGKRSPSPTPGPSNGTSSTTPLKRQPASFSNISKSQHRPPYTAEEKEKLRLAKGNANLAKEVDIRKKLRDIGIKCDVRGKDTKQSLWARLQEWTNIWNANLDSQNPKTKQVLIKELEAYERHQQIQKPSVVQDKGFEREAWSHSHNNEFEDLVAKARESAMRKKENDSTEKATATDPPPDSTGVQAQLNGIDSPEIVEV